MKNKIDFIYVLFIINCMKVVRFLCVHLQLYYDVGRDCFVVCFVEIYVRLSMVFARISHMFMRIRLYMYII